MYFQEKALQEKEESRSNYHLKIFQVVIELASFSNLDHELFQESTADIFGIRQHVWPVVKSG